MPASTSEISFFRALFLIAFCCLLTLAAGTAKAQGRTQVVQLSGLVVKGDSLYGLPNVAVFVRKAGRGTLTNEFGYFSLPVLAGDSITISSLGYKKHYILIPKNYTTDSYSVIVEMQEDVTMLPTVEIFPYPTEELFKEAFLSLRLPTKEQSNADKNLDQQFLQRVFASTPMDGGENQLYTQQQQVYNIERRNTVPGNPLLNPFAWSQLVKSIKRGDFKKQKGVDFDE